MPVWNFKCFTQLVCLHVSVKETCANDCEWAMCVFVIKEILSCWSFENKLVNHIMLPVHRVIPWHPNITKTKRPFNLLQPPSFFSFIAHSLTLFLSQTDRLNLYRRGTAVCIRERKWIKWIELIVLLFLLRWMAHTVSFVFNDIIWMFLHSSPQSPDWPAAMCGRADWWMSDGHVLLMKKKNG